MTENDSDINPSTDLQLPSAIVSGAAGPPPPALQLPARSLTQEPRWPHPTLGWALLWCFFFWVSTQLPGVIIAVLVAVVLFLVAPEYYPLDLSKPTELANSHAMNVGLAVAQLFTEILVIGFSYIVIRLVIGRDWKRQIALRCPGLTHTLLALVNFPILALLGNVTYGLLRESQRVPSISDANPLNLVYFWTAVFAVLGVSLLAAWLLAGYGWTRKLAARPARPADFLIFVIVLPTLLLCILVVYEWLRWTFPVPGLDTVKLAGMEEMAGILKRWPLGFAVLVIGLGPGIGEELWCRGFLGRGFVGNYGPVLGVLASSFCFGLIHLDPCQGTMAMLMGLWLHFVYLTTRSLLLPMMLHTLNNSLAVLDTRLPQLAIIETKPSDIPIVVYVSALLLLIATAFALYQSRARLAPKTPDQILIWQPAFEGVAYPPEDSGMQVIHPPASLAAMLMAGGAFLLFALACALWSTQG